MLQLGKKIRMLRQAKGWTQEQLVLGFANKSMLSQIESGKASPSIDLLLQIAKRLEIRIGELLQDVSWERKAVDLLKLANVLFDNQEYPSALFYFRMYLAEASNLEENLEIFWKLAVCLTETGEMEAALQYLEEVQSLAVIKNDAYWRFQALVQIGYAYFKQSNHKLALHYWFKAKDRLHTVTDLPPEQAWSLYNRMGVIFFYMDEHEKAVQYYMQGLEWINRPEFYSQRSITLMNLAISLKHLGEYEHAEEMYARLEEVEGELEPIIHAVIHFHYAIFLSAIGRYEEALARFTEVRAQFVELKEERRLVMVDSEIADFYRQQGRLDEAEKACEHLLDLPADHSEYGHVQRTLGLIYMEQTDYQRAISFFTRALHAFEQQGRLGNMKAIHEHLSVCLQKIGQY